MTLRTIGLAALTAAGLGSAAGAATEFTTFLDFSQEVGAGVTQSPSTAEGTLAIVRRSQGLALAFDLTFDDVHDFGPVLGGAFGQPVNAITQGDPNGQVGNDVTRLHIHNAFRGANGPVVFGLINPNTDLDGDVTVTQVLDGFNVTGEWDFDEGNGTTFGAILRDLVTLEEGEDAPLYFNLHTADDPAGAIRGQVVAANSVAAVPLPAALPLLLAALGGLGAMRRARKA